MTNKLLNKALHSPNINANKGFTLIELMISITLLSLLLFVGSYSYSLLSSRWNKELGSFNQIVQKAKKITLLQQLLEGIQTFVIVDNKKTPSFFFIGKNNSLLAVSRSGLFNEKYPVIFRISVIKKENGLVDLIYQSVSTQKIILVNTEQEVKFENKYTLLADVESISFKYFGWQHSKDKTASDKPIPAPIWFNSYSGIDAQLLPNKLQLSLTINQQSINIPVDLDTESELRLSPYIQDDE